MRYDYGDTFPGEAWTTMIWNSMSRSKNLIYNNQSGSIILPFVGTYMITISFEEYNGNGGGYWTV